MAPLTCAALLLIGLATTVAGPVNVRQNGNTECASYCPENTKFGFENGKTYEYAYESEVKTHIPGASTEHSSLHMNAKVKLEVLSRCEMALVMEDVVLEDVSPESGRRTRVTSNNEFARALERNPLRFAFVSGHVESLCPTEREETWVLNLKRGVLSNFQNSMNDFYTDLRLRENDVTGECPVTYATQGAGWNGVYTIKKTKNLEACQNRLSADTIFQGTAYKTPSKMQSLPVLKGQHECEQKINKQGILTESSCAESHVFRPFAKGNSGATTEVKTKLVYKKESTGIFTADGPISSQISIMFDHEKTPEQLTQSRQAVENIFTQMCAQTTPGVTAQAPSLFGKLVTELKKLNTDALVSLHRDISGGSFCTHAEKYLHDAVPTIGTVASARLIKELILSGEVSGTEEAMWLNSLAFVQNPSAAMLGEIIPLLRTNPLRRQAALAISSLVNNFCRTNSDCSNTRQVQDIVTIFGGHLVGGCRKAAKHHDVVLMSLKAIGNTGHAESIADSINMCIRNSDLESDLRLAAIQAFRRMACTADRSELTSVFENKEMDSELRINAYLSLMACPTEDIIRRVRNRLEVEEINQVGSFVWTHLTNLMETSSPLKQEIRQIVESESLSKQFDMDKRKFSRNIEKSYFSEMFNSGASVESNLIWSSESFVPRSASLNLTADLFGHSINLVEVGGRVEGINGLLDEIFDKNTPADENKDSTPEINDIDSKANIKRETGPKGSGYFRVFGNEISYVDFHDINAETVSEKFNYLNWLIELAKEHRVDYTKSFQFLDTTVTVATIAGFPLRMHVQGNAVTDIKMSGKFDIRSMAAAPRSLAIDGNFAPSAAVEIMAEMGIDAFATRTGLRTVDTLHTSTVANGRVTLRDGKIFELDINTPRNKMEVFSAKHDFFVVYRDQAHEIDMTGSKFEYSKCLGGSFTKVTGFEICGQIAVPNTLSVPGGPFAPLTAPASVSLVLNKKDTFSGYHFEAKALRELKNHDGHRDTIDVARVSFNTPGSKIDREITMDFSLNHSEKSVDISLVTPWSERAQFTGAFTNTAALKRATASASLGRTTYQALAEVTVSTNKYNTRYEPKFELTIPGKASPVVSGSLLYRAGRKIDINMVAENVFSESVTVSGSVTGVKQTKKIRYETELNIKSPLMNGKVDGFIDRTTQSGDVYSSRLEVVYKPSGGIRNRVIFSGKVRDKSNDKTNEMSGTMAFTSTLWAKYNTDLTFGVKQEGYSLETSFEGALAGSAEKTIKLKQSGILVLKKYSKGAQFEADVKFPYMNIDYTVKLDHEQKKGMIKSSAETTKDGRQHGLFSMDMAHEASPLKNTADIKLHYPGRRMRYTQTIQEISKKHYNSDIALQLQSDQIIHLSGDYKIPHRHELEATLTSPFTAPINFVGHLNPVVRDFDVKASVEHRGLTYAAEANLNAKPAEAKASMTLIHPKRKITSEIEMKNSGKTYSGGFDFKWDAARDTSKKVTLTGDITLAKMRPRLNIKAEVFPEHFIEMTTSGEFIHRADKCNHQGDFLFKSSIERFEEITASFKHKYSPNQMSASGELTYAPNKKIEGDFTVNLRSGWASVDANAKLRTPFPAFKVMTYELDYAQESNTFRANTKGMFNRQSIGLVVSGAATLPNIDGSVTLTSTFDNFKEIVLSGSHVDTGRKCHTEADLTWATGKKITLNYNGEHSRSGYHLNSNGDLTITTPFKQYRSNKITWRHSNDAGSLKHHTEIEMFKQKAAFDFDANIISNGPSREFHMKSTLIAPEVDMMINANHKHSIRNARGVTTDLTMQWATGKSIVITQNADLDNTGFVCLTEFTSPFEGFEKVTVDIDNRRRDDRYIAKNEIKWPGTKLSLDGSVTYRDTDIDANFELSTPYFPKQRLAFMTKQEGSNMISKRSYEYAPNKKIELNENLGLGSTKSYRFEFKSPCQYVENIYFDIEHVGSYRDFTHKIDFFHNMMADKVELVTKASTSDLADMKLNINLKTPFRPLTFMRAMYSHKAGDKDFTCTGSFNIPSYKAVFDHDMTVVSWRRFNTKSSLMYKPGEKIELGTRFQAANKIAALVTLKTPFEYIEDVAFKFNHEGSPRDMKTTAEIAMDKNNKIIANYELKMGYEGVQTFATIDTPFRGYKNLGMAFNLDSDKMDWSFNIENKRIAGVNIITLDEDRLNMRHSIQTPFSGYENILFTFQHEGRWMDFKHEGLFEYPGSRYTIKSNFAVEGTGLAAKSEIHTPFTEFRSFVVEVNHDGALRNFKNNVAATMNDIKYEAESSVKVTSREFNFNAKINVPRDFTITLAHNVDQSGGINKVFIVVNGQRLSAESKFLKRGSNIEGSFLMTSPFEGFEKFYFDGKHNGPWYDFNCQYALDVFGNRMTVTDEFKLEGDSLKLKLDIATPFRQLRSFSADISHDGPVSDFKNKAIIGVNNERYNAMSEFKMTRSSIAGIVSVSIPEEYSFTFNHAGSLLDFNNNFEVKAAREVYSGQSEFKLVGGMLDASATMNTPAHQSRKVSLKFNHESTATNFLQETTFTYGTDVFTYKAEAEREANDLKAKFDMETPFSFLRTFKIDVNHEGKSMRNFRNNIDIILNGAKRSASSDFKWFSTLFKLKLQASMPSDYSLLLKHKGDRTDFATSLLINTPTTSANSNCNFKLTDSDMTGSLSVNTPIRHFKSQSISFEVKKVENGFTSEAKILTDRPEVRSIEMAFNHAGTYTRFNTNGKLDIDNRAMNFIISHQGRISDFSSSASLTIAEQTGSAQVTYKKSANKIEATGAINTPFEGFDHFGFNLNHDGEMTDFQTTGKIETPFRNFDFSYNHKGRLNNFQCNVNLESDGSGFTGVWKFKNIAGDVEFDFNIQTPFRGYDKFGLIIKHDNHARGLKTSVEIETPFSGFENMNAEVSHDGGMSDFHTAGTINIPSHPVKFDLTHRGDRYNFNTNGFITYPGRKYSIAKTFKYDDGDLATTGSFEMPRRRYAYTLNHKFTSPRAFTTDGSIETPHRSYERASFKVAHNGDLNSFETSGELEPFHGHGSFDVNHRGRLADFTSSANAGWNSHKASANVHHRMTRNSFEASAEAELNDHKVTGNVKHSGSLNEFATSAEGEWNEHKVSGKVNHRGHLRDFASSAEAEYNDHKVSGSVQHSGHMNDFTSSAEAGYNEHKMRGNVNHRGDRNEFASSANAEWNSRKINGNVEFKNEDGNIDSSATLETPFQGYERFHAVGKHSLEGKKMKTEARLETPFRSIRNPSFDIQHRGHWKNFKTSATIVSPFKSVMPVTISANHRGIPKDFTSTANIEYGRDRITGTASYKRTPTGIDASADIRTPYEQAKKFGANFNYNYDGKNFNTRSNIETPHGEYKFFGVEIQHEGDLNKFETTGKVETPIIEPVHFEVNHQGGISDFKSSGNIEFGGRKIEGEASYKKSAGYFEADHDAFIRVATPFRTLRNADLTLRHAHNNGVFSGNVKGSYNGQTFDGDYNIANKASKSAAVTIRDPSPMKYTVSVHPASGRAEAFVNWDSAMPNKNLRFEAILKNEADSYNADRQFTFKVTCHSTTRFLTTGYTLTPEKFATKSILQWSESSRDNIVHEMEVSKGGRGRATIYDGLLKVSSPVTTFEVNGNHNINPKRRYLTEINFVTANTLQVRSDIKTPKGDFSDYSATFQVSEPRLSKPVKLEIEGKIESEKTLYDGKIDIEYAAEKITFTGKIADESTRYKTKYVAESSLSHPSNNVDMLFKSNLISSKKIFSTEAHFNYMMSRTRAIKKMFGKVSFDKIREEAKLEIHNPVKDIEISGRRTINDESRQHFSFSGSVDRRNIQAEVDVDRTIPGIDMTLDYASGKTLHMFGKYLSPDHFQVNAYRQESGKKIPEVNFDTEIVAGNLIKTRAFLRPTLFSDVSNLFSTNSGLGRLYSEVTEHIADDLRLKAPGFKRAAAPVIDALESLTNDFARLAVRFEREFNAMYKRNDYYTRDLSLTISRFFQKIRAGLDEVVNSATEAITSMESLYQEAAAKYDEWRRSTVVAYNRFYTEAAAKITHYRKVLQSKIDEHIDMAHASLLDLVNYIRTHPRVQACFDRIQNKAEHIVARLDELTEQLYEAGVRLLERPEMEYVRRYINNANARVAWVSEYINLKERAHEFLHHLKETGFSPLRRTIWRTIRDHFHFDETKITTWAPERGEGAGQVYLPATMRDLRSMPSLKFGGYFDNLRRFIPDTNWVFWDTLYAYKPSSDIRDWLPPFKSHATISGTQHYMTFDKKFFEFAGECSYLLARDMIDGTFSVVVNYKSDGIESTKKSITVIHGKDQVEILPEFRVEVNGRRSEMPVITQHTAVYRVGNTLRIDNDHGVKIACNLPHDHCTVSVTGWYYGKTGGLLGTYDNEPATDFKKINGEMAASIEELTSSWTVGRQCRAVNRAHINEVSPLSPNFQRCSAIFQEESSSFRPCFLQVKPEAFMKMCMNGDVCKVASFYVHECGMHEVPIRMPRECVQCELPTGQRLSEGQEETLSSSDSRKADVVFVVSHGECNQDAVDKLDMLANQVLKGMKEIKVKDVKFGLVGFGGEDRESEPHSHTMDGQLINSKTTFIQTIRNFRATSGNTEEDALAAIRFASNYPFRAGASKSIILVPCQKCSADKTPYSVIQEALSERDIRFHMLIHQDFELRASTKSPKTSYMFGLDRESVYTNKDVGSSDIRGDKDLRRHTVAPKDLCVALTHESDGSVFNVLKLTQTKTIGQKRFSDVFSRVLAKKGTPSECQVCECRSDETGVGISVCKSCEPPAPYVYSWDHIQGLPEPELYIPKKGRSSKKFRG